MLCVDLSYVLLVILYLFFVTVLETTQESNDKWSLMASHEIFLASAPPRHSPEWKDQSKSSVNKILSKNRGIVRLIGKGEINEILRKEEK